MSDTTIERPTVAEYRKQLLETADKARELRAKPKSERSAEEQAEYVNTNDLLNGLDAELRAVERASAVEEQSQGPDVANTTPQVENRSVGQQFVESEQYKEHRGAHVDPHEVRALLDFADTGSTAAFQWAPVATPTPPNAGQMRQAKLFVRDLLTVQQTGLATVPYIRELTPATTETGATSVAEGAAKAEVSSKFERDDAPTRKIAAWIPITEEIVEDAPTLMGYINNRLAYMLKLTEQAQILNGNGVSPNLKGIRNYTGGSNMNLQTQSAVSGDYPATVGLSIAKIENVDGDADGIVWHPTDFWTMLTTRHSNGLDGGFGGALPYAGAPNGIWGLANVRTRSMTAGKALVGAWRFGATLHDRMQTNIRTTDSHSDYFIYNKLVVLAEERVALEVDRPDFFVEATL